MHTFPESDSDIIVLIPRESNRSQTRYYITLQHWNMPQIVHLTSVTLHSRDKLYRCHSASKQNTTRLEIPSNGQTYYQSVHHTYKLHHQQVLSKTIILQLEFQDMPSWSMQFLCQTSMILKVTAYAKPRLCADNKGSSKAKHTSKAYKNSAEKHHLFKRSSSCQFKCALSACYQTN